MRRRILPFLLSVAMILSSVTPVNAGVLVVEDHSEEELILYDEENSEETVEVNDSEVSDEKDSYATEEIEKLTEPSEELLGNDGSETSDSGYDYEYRYIYYRVNDENNTAAICKISNIGGPYILEKITVNGKEYEVTSILEGACTGGSNIEILDCPWSVKSISGNAINASDCPNLERIVLASDAVIADDILESYNDMNSGLTIYTDKQEGRLIDQLKSYPNIKLKYKYTVTWDWQVAGVEPFVDEQDMTDVNIGELTYPTGGEPDNPGYTFDGWYTDKTYKNKWNIYGDNPTKVEDGVSNINLYAKWTPNEYDVSIDFLVNGKGYFEEEDFEEDYINEHRYELHQTVTYPDTQYTFDISKLPVPKGIYCEFEGWYTKAEGGDKVTSSTYTVGVDNTAENQSVALYAHYNNTQYSIELDLAGGEFEEGYTYPTSYTYWDEEPLIEIPIPVRKGYTFQHWAKIENGEEEEWAYNLIIRKTDHHKNLKFIAKWQIKPYDIKYYPGSNDGVLPEGNPTSYTVEDEISLKPATKIGYEFLGWEVSVIKIGNDNDENPIDGTIINKIPKGTTGWLNLSAVFGGGAN